MTTPEPMPAAKQTLAANLAVLLQLEQSVRHAPTRQALAFIIVNDTRRLITYRQAVLVLGSRHQEPQIEAVSSLAVLDRHSPFQQWFRRFARFQFRHGEATRLAPIDSSALPSALARDWQEWTAGYLLWCPLLAADDRLLGALCLLSDKPWPQDRNPALEMLIDAFAHAFLALTGPALGRKKRPWRRLKWVFLALGLFLFFTFPVRQTALGPAEIVPLDPFIVAAPMDGIVKSFAVRPNQAVAPGDLLFSMEDTELRNALDVAERSLDIVLAEYRSASQGTFLDRRNNAKLVGLEAQVALRRAERDFARWRLSRVAIKAQRSGIAVFTDPQAWIGQPVGTGQPILKVADPQKVQVRIHLPVGSVISLDPGAGATVFLDIDPLLSLEARVETLSYEPEMTPSGHLAYRITARLEETDAVASESGTETAGACAASGCPPEETNPEETNPEETNKASSPRIGLQGTASLQGDWTPMFLYLFRQPVAFFRQSLGI